MKAILHGQCLIGGKHTPGSQWERECPLRNAEKRSERTRKGNQARRAATEAPGPAETPQPAAEGQP
jgi:hypothetical protein